MTLPTRNRILIATFVATVPAIVTIVVSYPELVKAVFAALPKADHRAKGLIEGLSILVFKPSAWALLISLPVCCVYAAGTIAMLYYSFEKTQAPEILFFAFFAFSFLGETFRMAIPIAFAREWPPAIVVYAARIIAFGRFAGVLSLFAAGVYANGLDFQKHGRVIIIIAVAALTIATGIPIDGLTYDASFTPLSGYRFMLDLTELSIALFAVLSFFVAAYVKSAREIYAASLGILFVTIGRDFVLRGDSWAAALIGGVLLFGGTWLFAVKIHRYYLWL
ncbi:MAG: hypothetical protein WCT14_14880 [Treponemataceae bacterium]